MTYKQNFLAVTAIVILYSIICFTCLPLDLSIIKQIESSGNPLAYNKTSGARGHYQITKICLTEYNNFNKTNHTLNDLFNPIINEKIASWYISKRIPQMLKHYGFPVTIENQIIAYNAGISYVVKNKTLPTETVNYIAKYKGAK